MRRPLSVSCTVLRCRLSGCVAQSLYVSFSHHLHSIPPFSSQAV